MNPPYKRVALGFVVAVGMLGVVPGVAFAANPTCGTTIMSNTTLSADVDCTAGGMDGITFGKKGITLNLNGHTIWGPTSSDSYSGVNTNNKKHVTVKNGTISDFDTGVYAQQSVGGTFSKLTLVADADDSDPVGIYVGYGGNNTLNKIHTSDFYIGVYLYGAVNNWISNGKYLDDEYGVYTEYDSQDHFVNNYAEAWYAGFYEDYGGGQTWTNNEANGDENGADYGFYFDCDTYGAVWASGNEAYGNDDYGFYIYYCYDWTNPSANPSVVKNNSAHDNAGDSAYGFYDYESLYATYTNNVATTNEYYGFDMESSGQVVFKSNVANHNGGDGIYTDTYSTSYNFASFANNKANSNDGYGIDGDYAIPNASGNTAHGNGTAPDDCYNVECNQ